MALLPIQRMQDRVEIAKRTNDDAYFRELMLLGEMIMKVAIAGMIASIVEGPNRDQYRLKYLAVRASAPGGWASVMEKMRDREEFPSVIPITDGNEFSQLTKKTKPGDWQYESVNLLFKCLKLADYTSDEILGPKPKAYEWFQRFSELRNKAKSHRAPFTAITSAMCPLLYESINLFLANFTILGRPWGHLVRNMNSTYQVVRWTGENEGFSQLEGNSRGEYVYQDGIYIEFPAPNGEQTLYRVDLMKVSQNGMDVYLPNGNFRDNYYEMLSYTNDHTILCDSKIYLLPPSELPASETHGRDVADTHGILGNTIHNMPNKQSGYVPRATPELKLYKEIIKDDQHPIITLNGRGGIGKTWLTLEVLHRIAAEDMFDFILWFSARSIDLMPDGPKPVKPHIQTKRDVATEFADLIGTWILNDDALPAADPIELIQDQMQGQGNGRMLFVFDNFESLEDQMEMYYWIDTYVKLPNKAVITTRMRRFTSDTPIELLGMSKDESTELIHRTATKLEIKDIISSSDEDNLIQISDGHPYILKVLLGEVKRQGTATQLTRMFANKEHILDALFENIYSELSPLARRIFLTLCELKTVVAEFAIQAVLIGSDNQPMDILKAIDELHFSSLIEKNEFEDEEEFFCSVPYVTTVFGKRKLSTDSISITIQSDTEFLRYFGTNLKSDIDQGVHSIIRKFFSNVETRVLRDSISVEDFRPTMEFVAHKYSEAWLQLADLYEKTREFSKYEITLKHCIGASTSVRITRDAWDRLVRYYESNENYFDELFAHVRLAQLPQTRFSTISDSANRFNEVYSRYSLRLEEKEKLIEPLIDLMQPRIEEADARDCSRLGWLYMHNDQLNLAKEAVQLGLELDPRNHHCQNLLKKL